MRSDAAASSERLRAAVWNVGVGVIVSGLFSGAVLAGRKARPRRVVDPTSGPVHQALTDAALTVLPWVALGMVDDTGAASGWGGKTRAGLVLTDSAGGRTSLARTAVREIVKYAPWQLAHLGIRQQTDRDRDPEAPPDTADRLGQSALVLALGLAVADGVSWLRTGSTLHDRVAGTTVTRGHR